MKVLMRVLVAILAGMATLASLALPASSEINVTSDPRQPDPGRTTTSNVIDVVRSSSDGPKLDVWSRSCGGFCYYHGSAEWDFGSGPAVARCRQMTSSSSGGTSTICSPGQGDWMPPSPATITYWHDGGAIRARVQGVLSDHQSGDIYACNVSVVRASFRYADGSSDTQDSPCGRVDNPVNLVSTAGHDVVQVQLFVPASCACVPGDLVTSDVLGEGQNIIDTDTLRHTVAGQSVLSDAGVRWQLGNPQDGQQACAICTPPPWRPVLSMASGMFYARHYSDCGPSFARQLNRLVLRWAHVHQPTTSVYFRSDPVAEGSSAGFGATNPALNFDNGEPANPFELHMSIEVSTDGGRTWGACGGDSWVKLGDA